MEVTVKIRTDNAAFANGNLQREVARILRDAANKVSEERVINLYDDGDKCKLFDLNGNSVGTIEIGE